MRCAAIYGAALWFEKMWQRHSKMCLLDTIVAKTYLIVNKTGFIERVISTFI